MRLASSPLPRQARDEVEARLLEAVRVTRLAWQHATHDTRDAALATHVDAIQAYSWFLAHGEVMPPLDGTHS